jgi:hypothetical protein
MLFQWFDQWRVHCRGDGVGKSRALRVELHIGADAVYVLAVEESKRQEDIRRRNFEGTQVQVGV